MDHTIDLFGVINRLKQLVVEIGKLQQENLGSAKLAFAIKSTAIDIVTEIDKKSEEKIIAFVKEYYPSHAVLAEESGRSEAQSDYLWIIDPLDGTTNYAQGLPIFSISIALEYRGQTILGMVYAPVLDELYYAVRGQGAFLNNRPIHVSNKTQLLDSVLATGFPYDVAEHPANNINYFTRLLPKTRAIRRFGSAAYDLASVACGRFDGYWELNLSQWDAAAGILLVEEAGGIVAPFRQDRKVSIIAGNNTIVGQIYNEIKTLQ
ncbi:inositol monophosphatase family protein [Sporomusa sp.]|uniref:inositol monophosphatase family protein n=1 Tax=Sporomusa sp. TaxID=2078658 RepID=UPI002C9ADB14|nr:inositol monophosphatase family protein [Sporomusa sp.]HWR10109.1 inositol monophosphatase family protein [Sporomusa sp.]